MKRAKLSLPLFLVPIAAAVLLLAGTAVAQAPGQAEPPLTNEEVVKLCKLGLGDEVVIAKINQAREVNFQLDTDSLVKLKEQGVSKPVIEAMLKRTTPTPSPAQSAREAIAAMGETGGVGTGGFGEEVILRTKDGELRLKGRKGDLSMTYAYVAMLRFLDIPNVAAATRTTDKRPSVIVRLSDDPRQSREVFLVKLDPDKDDNKRSLKIGKERMFKVSTSFAPDEDWTIPFDATQEGDGKWVLTPKADLKPGEYGVHFGSLWIFDFGVDK